MVKVRLLLGKDRAMNKRIMKMSLGLAIFAIFSPVLPALGGIIATGDVDPATDPAQARKLTLVKPAVVHWISPLIVML